MRNDRKEPISVDQHLIQIQRSDEEVIDVTDHIVGVPTDVVCHSLTMLGDHWYALWAILILIDKVFDIEASYYPTSTVKWELEVIIGHVEWHKIIFICWNFN